MKLAKICQLSILFTTILLFPLIVKAQINHSPIITSDPSNSIQAGQTYVYDVEASDQDNDILTYSLTTLPDGMTINQSSGLIKWMPTLVGQYNVVLQVTDQKGGYDTQACQITVTPAPLYSIVITPNDRPTLVALGSKKQFYAKFYDRYNNEISKLDFIWLTEPKIGKIDQSGLFTATAGGVGYVAIEKDEVKASIGVIVKGAITSISTEEPTPQPSPKPTSAPKPRVLGETITEKPKEAEKTPENVMVKAEETKKETTCQNWSNLIIILILIIYSIILIIYYLFIKRYREKKVRGWWIIPLFLTAVGIIIYFKYFCKNTYIWWPFILAGIGIIITLYYLWITRRKSFSQTELPF